ncbi:MAG: LON peptidase substrate-binding domain-containing protein [bacterium]|nr:LON peptidase substrate-binding domain-containing protein [bacterium]
MINVGDIPSQTAVFPLANSLLFPHAVQALHIFEPRYVTMVENALKGDCYISMALLKPGYEKEYHNSPEIYSTACLGRIIDQRRLSDNRFHIALQGVMAVDLSGELEDSNDFRTFSVSARVFEEDLSSAQELDFRNEFYKLLESYFFLQSGLRTDPKTLCADMSFAALLDNLCFLIPLDSEKKMKLLRCSKSSERCFLFKSFLEMEIDKLHRSAEKGPASLEGGPGPFYPRGGSGGGPIVH